MTEPSTPLMRQYAAVKKEHPTALLFFRLGDFYELFFDDAIVAAKELQITLTSRNKEKGIAVPMCGVPHHAAEGYIGKLIRKGFKVAICEQMEDARLAKKQIGTKLVRREVTRVVTPGTAADSLLGSEENNFLAALAQVGESVGFAALDLSTGEFRATEFSGENALRRVQEEGSAKDYVCLLSAGEVTVSINGRAGRGGRNQQWALEVARLLDGTTGIVALSAGSDGIDGNSPAAGAIVESTTWSRALARGIDPRRALDDFDTYPLFAALGDALVHGPSGNNVRDIRMLLRHVQTMS